MNEDYSKRKYWYKILVLLAPPPPSPFQGLGHKADGATTHEKKKKFKFATKPVAEKEI